MKHEGDVGGVEARCAKGVGRYCNARDMPDSILYVCVCVCVRYVHPCVSCTWSRLARLSLIHIHQTLINHRPAHPRRATPLAGHEAGKKNTSAATRTPPYITSYIQMSKSPLCSEISRAVPQNAKLRNGEYLHLPLEREYSRGKGVLGTL